MGRPNSPRCLAYIVAMLAERPRLSEFDTDGNASPFAYKEGRSNSPPLVEFYCAAAQWQTEGHLMRLDFGEEGPVWSSIVASAIG